MDILPILLDSQILHTISQTLMHFTWQGVLIAGLLFSVKHLTSNKHSQLRYIFFLSCLLMCAIAPLITYFVLSSDQSYLSEINQPQKVILTSTVDVINNELNKTLNIGDYSPLIAVLWMVGIVFLTVKLLAQMWQIHRLTHDNIVSPSDTLLQRFERLKLQIGGVKRSKLIISLNAHVPMAIGWLKPVVLLPANLASGLTIPQLEMLMAHELAHLKRYDYLINLVQTFVEIVLFFHPCVKWISKQIRIEREFCCDDIAMHHAKDQVVYARTLTDAEILRQSIPELAMAATGGELTSRVHRVVGQHTCAPKYANQWLAAIAVTLIIPTVLTASKVIAMTQTPEAKQTQFDNLNVMVLKGNRISQPKQEIIRPASKTNDTPVIINHADKVNVTSNKDSNSNHAAVEVKANQTDLSSVTVKNTNNHVKSQVFAASNALSISKKDVSVIQNISVHSQSYPAKKVSKKKDESVILDTHLLSEEETAHSKETGEISNVHHSIDISTRQSNVQSSKASSKLFNKENTHEGLTATSTKNHQTDTKPLNVAIETDNIIAENTLTDAKLISSVMPDYPRFYNSKNRISDVIVSFIIDKRGMVADIVYQDNVKSRFKRTVTRALRQWRFEPATINGEPTPTNMTKVFSFSNPNQYLRPITGSRIAHRIR